MTFFRDRLPDPVQYFEGQGLPFVPRGKWMTTRCEGHGGSDSLRFNRDSGAFVCMAGCGLKGGDVLAYQMSIHGQDFVTAAKALGAWQDDPADSKIPRRKPLPFPARDALEILADESNLVAVAAGNVAHGVPMSIEDRERLIKAASRIRIIKEACA